MRKPNRYFGESRSAEGAAIYQQVLLCLLSAARGLLVQLLPLSICLLCCLWLVQSGFCQAVTKSHNASQIIRGIVVNKLTGEPISRALVFSLDNSLGMLTDDSGRFEFTISTGRKPSGTQIFTFGNRNSSLAHISAGSDNLIIKKPGFLEDAEVTSHQDASGRNLTISLLPEAIIHGRVLISNNEPAEGMNVQLFQQEVREGAYHWSPLPVTRTNSLGEFRFADLRPGAYKVMTQELPDTDPQDIAPNSQVYGFPPVCFPGVPNFASGSTIPLTAGQDFQADIPLARQAYFRVRIPVLNASAVQFLNVGVFAGDRPGPGYSLGYNPRTDRIEGLLPNGIYHVEADSYAPTPASGAVDIRIAGAAVEGPSLAVLPNGVIPVNVHEEFNSEWKGSASWNINGHSFELRGPRAYLHISLETADDFLQRPVPSMRTPMSANDDSLAIEDARPGRYWVHVFSSRGYVQSMTSGNHNLLGEPLILSSGAHAPIEITMRDDAAKIEGRVKGISTQTAEGNGGGEVLPESSGESSSQDRPSAYVVCIPLSDGPGQFQLLTTLRDGTIMSPAMAPGSYRVLAFEHFDQNFAYRDPQVMRAYESLGQVVTLSPGQTQHVELQLIPDE